jgi:tetratricopeptide (TPR) repeat protein
MKNRDEIIQAAHKHKLQGNIDDAIAEYLKILPYSVEGNIHNIIGDLYLKINSTAEAIKYFREAAVIFNKDESHAKAIALYHKILSINPDQPDVVIELAKLNAERGFIKVAVDGLISAAKTYYSKGLPMKALGLYKKTLTVCPSDTELKIKIADLHLETNHTDSAIQMYLTIAMEYEANAESVKAENMYKKIISQNPDNIESLTHLSRLAEDAQDLELAFEYMSKAAAIAPHNSDIMFDYSNLAAKANKDISEYLPKVPDEPDHKKPQKTQLPDAVKNSDTVSNVHEPMNLSSENSNPQNIYSSEPISTSTSPLPITSTGSGYEETGFTVPTNTDESLVEKKGIWDEIYSEDKNNTAIIDSIHEKNSKVLKGHETAEPDYDQNPGDYEFNFSVKEPDHEKKEKDSRRVKRRVKSNRLHVALIFFFIIVTAISFFVAYKFINKSQTVDVETPVHTIPQETLPIKEAKTGESSSETSKASAQNKTNTQVTEAINNKNNIKADDQGVSTLPVKETESAINDSKTNEDSTDEITLNEVDSNLTDIQIEVIESTIKPGSEIEQEKENSNIDIKTLTVPDTADEIILNDEDSNLNDIQKDVIESTMKPDSEIGLKNENTHIDTYTLTVPETTDEMKLEEDPNHESSAIISFTEPFDNNNNNWDIIQTSAAYVRLLDGKYYIQNMRKSGAYIILNGPDLSTDNNFEVKAHLTSIDNSGNYSFGLIFGAKDKEDFFVFQMLSEHEYSIRKYYRGVSLELAGGEINSKPESQDTFTVLKINSTENKLSFFINGNYVDEVSDISFSNRKTGFFVNGQAEIVVDKILLNQQPR